MGVGFGSCHPAQAYPSRGRLTLSRKPLQYAQLSASPGSHKDLSFLSLGTPYMCHCDREQLTHQRDSTVTFP